MKSVTSRGVARTLSHHRPPFVICGKGLQGQRLSGNLPVIVRNRRSDKYQLDMKMIRWSLFRKDFHC